MTYRYFSGFCLENEDELFKEYIKDSTLNVVGFSYGAIKAFEYTLQSEKRIDSLQLISPAFFQVMDKKVKRMQLMFFKKDINEYKKNFLSSVVYPQNIDMEKYYKEGSVSQLEELLNYEWDTKLLESLIKKGIKIEVFLGEKDKIIDANKAKEFFKNFATVYYIKEKGHIL